MNAPQDLDAEWEIMRWACYLARPHVRTAVQLSYGHSCEVLRDHPHVSVRDMHEQETVATLYCGARL